MHFRPIPAFISAMLVVSVLALAGPVSAQSNPIRDEWLAGYKHFGLAGALTYPFQEFGEENETGYGLHAVMDYPVIPLLNLTADAGWNRFPRANGDTDLDVVNVTFGGKISLGSFYIGGETGYYSKVDEWSWVPSMGLRIGGVELTGRWKATGKGTWTTLRLGYYFF